MFVATPSTIDAGSSTKLCWQVTGATNIQIPPVTSAMIQIRVIGPKKSWSAAMIPANPWVMVAILVVCFSALGAGNGAVFQLVPLRFKSTTAVAGSLIGEMGALVENPAEFNRRIVRIDELRVLVQERELIFRMVSDVSQLAEWHKFSADRKLAAASLHWPCDASTVPR